MCWFSGHNISFLNDNPDNSSDKHPAHSCFLRQTAHAMATACKRCNKHLYAAPYFLYNILMNIVLLEPEIPANTGNIGRTCVATGTTLHLIEPLGFKINEKTLKRAGLDYWDKLDVRIYKDYEDFLEKCTPQRIYMSTTKAHKLYTDAKFNANDYIMFGRESAGIPEEILVDNEENCIRIPMIEEIRSLNLSNSVAIVLYEALHQLDFQGMQDYGQLHRLSWK